MIHLTLNQISAYIDAELPEASVELVRLHLSSCLECTERFGHIEEQESALSRLLVNDPGEAFYSGFADRVLGPPPAAKKPPAEVPVAPVVASRVAPDEDPVAAPVETRVEARVAAPVEPQAVAAATRPASTEPPAPPRPAAAKPAPSSAPTPTPRRKPPARKPGRARFLVPAAALLILASAGGVMVTRTGNGIPPIGSLFTGSRAAHPEPPATPKTADSGARAPAAGDVGSLERAAAQSAEAERLFTAEAYDAAAVAWTEALPQLEGDPEELAAGRREVASARYAAWVDSPTPERRTAATEAVRGYLLCAPPGAQRDQAWTWLAQLKR